MRENFQSIRIICLCVKTKMYMLFSCFTDYGPEGIDEVKACESLFETDSFLFHD